MRTLTLWLSLFLIFTIPWESNVVIPGLGSVARFVGLVITGIWLISLVVTNRFRMVRPFHLGALLFVLWNAASVFWSIDIDLTASRVQTYLELMILVLIIWDLYTTPTAIKQGLQAFVLGTYVSSLSLLDNFLSAEQYAYGRYSSGSFDPNDLGVRLAMGIPIAWYLAVSTGQGKLARLLAQINYAYIPIAILAVLLTASRTAFLAVFPGVLFMLVSFTRLRLVSRIVIAGALVLALSVLQPLVPEASLNRISKAQSSIAEGDLTGRGEIWAQGIAIFVEHPLLGIGSGAFRRAIDLGKPPHNIAVSLLTELGVIGFLLFAVTFVSVFIELRHLPKWEAGLWVTLFIVWCAGATTLNWEHKKVTWLLLSMAASAILAAQQRNLAEQLNRTRLYIPNLPMRPKVTPLPVRADSSEG